MLHIVNKSPFERGALDTCLKNAQAGSAVLLTEDGVYAAMRGAGAEGSMQEAMKTMQVYALAPDLEARGVHNRVIDGIKLVDYAGFVDLVCEHNNCQSWL